MKKYIKIVLSCIVIFTILALASILISHMKLQKVELSVVNPRTYKESEISEVFESAEDQTIYVFVYDEENEDCIYLDEVMLRQVSNENGELHFDNIYKINYQNSAKTYNNQQIKNLYSIETIPAIVKVKKTADGYEILDKFEWSSDTAECMENLKTFLHNNGIIE